MDRKTIIDGLKMTMELCVFDPSTGEEIEPHLLNDINRATYDACKGALEILEQLPSAQPETNCSEIPNNSDTISRQNAIDALGEEPYGDTDYDIGIRNQWKWDVEAIQKLPSAEPHSIKLNQGQSSDMISRQAVLDNITTSINQFGGRYTTEMINMWGLFTQMILQLPSAEPQERKTGKWIQDRSGAYCCSECMEPCAGYVMMRPRDKFCKMCGARMEVD